MIKRISVFAEWDPEADVYFATSDDIPGLVTEGANQEELWDNLVVLIPELLELNGHLFPKNEDAKTLSVTLHLKKESQVRVHA
jgi:predicted RNase H-like HicB family nuclease